MVKRKVVFIGAGSVVFFSGLMADLIADGGEWEVGLVDIKPENLEAAWGLARRLVEAKSAPITLSKSLERRDLLPGADYVVTTIDVGGRPEWEKDIYIPRKYGVFVPVADTTTPGGFARSLRILPVLVEIARDIVELCPKAQFLNYSNPMAAIVRAVNREVKKEVFGLCHGVSGVRKYFGKFLDVDPSRCDVRAVGFNHFVWLMDFKVDGQDAYPAIHAKNEQLKAEGKLPGDDPDHQTAWGMLELFGYFPISRDRHICEFFPQFHADGSHYGKTLGVDRFRFEDYLEWGDRDFLNMQKVALGEAPLPENLLNRKVGDGEELINILRAMESDTPQIFHTSVPNVGQVENLARDICPECPVEISKHGAKPVPLGKLPLGIKANIDKAFLTTELIIDAALERDRAKFVQAIVLDGCVKSLAQCHALADELIAAHKAFMPGW